MTRRATLTKAEIRNLARVAKSEGVSVRVEFNPDGKATVYISPEAGDDEGPNPCDRLLEK
jgi:hypothetical protein